MRRYKSIVESALYLMVLGTERRILQFIFISSDSETFPFFFFFPFYFYSWVLNRTDISSRHEFHCSFVRNLFSAYQMFLVFSAVR